MNCCNKINEVKKGGCSFLENPAKPTLEIVGGEAEQKIPRISDCIVFICMLSGKADITCHSFSKPVSIEENCIISIPRNASFAIRFTAAGQALIYYDREQICLCKRVVELQALKTEQIAGKPLKINEPIIDILHSFSDTVDLGLKCTKYYKLKMEELFILLFMYYTDDELYSLFQPAFSDNVAFKQIIIANRNKLFKVNDFASETHLSRDAFRKHFRDCFGTTPQEWILSERKQLILNELKSADAPIHEISAKCGFLSVPEFYNFCRKHFGKTPSELRKIQS
ncbi:MAG: helix-turn-helix transcriptional regulator [Dysgonamonadaceae bacterium]|jgi:AraC-like DNA-binding protein|nr:helix-turn-helix transcriptional regulator [Dysgonamonadaceae bacterium]